MKSPQRYGMSNLNGVRVARYGLRGTGYELRGAGCGIMDSGVLARFHVRLLRPKGFGAKAGVRERTVDFGYKEIRNA